MNFKTYMESVEKVPEKTLDAIMEWVKDIMRDYSSNMNKDSNTYSKDFQFIDFPYEAEIPNTLTIEITIERLNKDEYDYLPKHQQDDKYDEIPDARADLHNTNNPAIRMTVYAQSFESSKGNIDTENIIQRRARAIRQVMRHELTHVVDKIIGGEGSRHPGKADWFSPDTHFLTGGEFQPIMNEIITIAKTIKRKEGHPMTKKTFRKGMQGWSMLPTKNYIPINKNINLKLKTVYRQDREKWETMIRKVYGELKKRDLVQ